jgi:hypothetical protein
MPYKQIFLTLDRGIWEKAKRRSIEEEKRSLTAQIRKLYADLPQDKLRLRALGEQFRNMQTVSGKSSDTFNVTLKFPEDELWDAREKSAQARMMLKDFTTHLLELWAMGNLNEVLSQAEITNPTETVASKGKRNVVRRAN